VTQSWASPDAYWPCDNRSWVSCHEDSSIRQAIPPRIHDDVVGQKFASFAADRAIGRHQHRDHGAIDRHGDRRLTLDIEGEDGLAGDVIDGDGSFTARRVLEIKWARAAAESWPGLNLAAGFLGGGLPRLGTGFDQGYADVVGLFGAGGAAAIGDITIHHLPAQTLASSPLSFIGTTASGDMFANVHTHHGKETRI